MFCSGRRVGSEDGRCAAVVRISRRNEGNKMMGWLREEKGEKRPSENKRRVQLVGRRGLEVQAVRCWVVVYLQACE